MDTSANGQNGAQASKRRRLNDSQHAWQSANDANTQVPPPWRPELVPGSHYLDRPLADYGRVTNHLPRAQDSTSITSLASSSSGPGGRILWPSPSTPFPGQSGYHHLTGALPLPPSFEPVLSPWTFPHGVAPSFFYDQTSFRHTGAQPAETGYGAPSTLPPLSMAVEVPCTRAVCNGQEPDTEPNHSSAVSRPEQKNASLPKTVCFGMVGMHP
jgi:hypothetical protein